MSQKTNPKRILDNEAISVGRNIRVSPQKLNLVAQSIRGIEASKAIAYLTFSKKRISTEVKKVFSGMSTVVTSPIRQKKVVRRALNLTHRNITERAAKAVQNAKRRAQLTKMMKEGLKISIRKPPQLLENEKRKTSKIR